MQQLRFWDRLKAVKQMSLCARSHSIRETGWNGEGKGEVLVIQENERILVFHERGFWQTTQDPSMAFRNTLRWTLDGEVISLEHLRLGPDHPVFLFHLAPICENLLACVDSHLCKDDTYLAQIEWDQDHIRLAWRVIGPEKNEEMEIYYY